MKHSATEVRAAGSVITPAREEERLEYIFTLRGEEEYKKPLAAKGSAVKESQPDNCERYETVHQKLIHFAAPLKGCIEDIVHPGQN